jgi:hypothetical protein
MRVWALLVAGLGSTGLGCSGSPCEQVADLLRECCAKGPAELRQTCEAEAKRLEDDGNADACQMALDQGDYDRCVQ